MELLKLLSIPILVAVNAYFVAVEFALVAVRRTQLEELEKQGDRRAKAAKYAVEHLENSIAASQLGITVASIALGSVGEPAVAHLLEPFFTFLPEGAAFLTRHGLATVIALAFITVVHVVLGEQVPKLMAIQSADKAVLFLAPPLNLFARITSPILKVMNAAGNFILRRLGYKPGGEEHDIHSVEELKMLVDQTEHAGLIDSESADYVQNVFELKDKKIREIMVTLEKMDAIEIRTPSDQILEFVRESGHTRIPVYDGEKANVVGVLNSKNLFYFFSLGSAVVLEDAIYPPTFIRDDETIANALRTLKQSHRPMAIVKDASDAVIGMITLEDILEEIVGDIEDEHDGATHMPGLQPGALRRLISAARRRSPATRTIAPPAPPR